MRASSLAFAYRLVIFFIREDAWDTFNGIFGDPIFLAAWNVTVLVRFLSRLVGDNCSVSLRTNCSPFPLVESRFYRVREALLSRVRADNRYNYAR